MYSRENQLYLLKPIGRTRSSTTACEESNLLLSQVKYETLNIEKEPVNVIGHMLRFIKDDIAV